MNPQQTLHILYDLALCMAGESDSQALAKQFIQRLLYHSGFPCAAFIRVPRSQTLTGAGGLEQAELLFAIGNRDLQARAGQLMSWPSVVLSGKSGLMPEAVLSAEVFPGAERYPHVLRLQLDEQRTLLLLGARLPANAHDVSMIFQPVLGRFLKAYDHCVRIEHQEVLLRKAMEDESRAAAALHFSQQQFNTLIDLSPQAVAVIDRNSGAFVDLNQAASDLLGYTLGDLPDLEHFWHKALPDPAYRELVRADWQAYLQDPAPFSDSASRTVRLTTRDGDECHVEYQAKQVAGRVIVTFFDVTARRQREEALASARDYAEKTSQARLSFLSSMSHELRTPLNAILGFAQLLELDGSLDEDQAGAVKEILQAGERLSLIVSGGLDLHRVESDTAPMVLAELDPNDILQGVLDIQQTRYPTIHFGVQPELVSTLFANRSALGTVLDHLISNAAKFNKPGGTVRVEGRVLANGRYRIEVLDTGRGIADARQQELFQPFNRLGMEGSNIPGSGTGLVLAKRLTERMQGEIGFESSEALGSRFWIDLPFSAAVTGPAAGAPSAEPLTAAGEAGVGTPAEMAGNNAVKQVEDAAGYLAHLEAFLGCGEEGRQVLRTFAETALESLAEADSARLRQEASAFQLALQKVKSSARTIGADQIGDAALNLEMMARAQDWVAVRRDFAAFAQGLRELAAQIMDHDPAPADPSAEASATQASPALSPAASAARRAVDLPALHGVQVLALDDDSFIRQYLQRVLQPVGLGQLHLGSDGREGLEIISAHGQSIQLILCDLNMPNMDGIEFIRHLGQTQFRGSLVLISGEEGRVLNTVYELAKSHGLDVLGTIAKPFSPSKLYELLARFAPVGTATPTSRSLPDFHVTPVEFERGLQNGEFSLHFQPKVAAGTLKVFGAEVLARWHHPVHGAIPPVLFIPMAEENGLIDALFLEVLGKAVGCGAELARQGVQHSLAINIATSTLNSLDVPEFVVSCAQRAGIDPSTLILEVTESGLMKDMRIALDVLTRLRLKRVGLAIDDFGTGYSSMDQLRRIPFGELKIDRSFVSGAHRDAAARQILESSLQMARKLGLKTVAEGVETDEDLALVRNLGCDLVQGYYVSRPMPWAQYKAWLAKWPHG